MKRRRNGLKRKKSLKVIEKQKYKRKMKWCFPKEEFLEDKVKNRKSDHVSRKKHA